MLRLNPSSNGHYIETSDGAPFMWMAAVVWRLFVAAGRTDARYLLDELSKPEHKYNVIYAVAAMSRRQEPLNPFNAKGSQAFNGGDIPDFTSPKIDPGGYDYWDHVDYIINEARMRGIYVVLLPQWSNMFIDDAWSRGLQKMDADTARVYGEWLGNRYKSKDNVMWMLGGDGGDARARGTRDIYRAQAEGILKGVTGCTLCPRYNTGSDLWSQVFMMYHGSSPTVARTSQIFDSDDKWFHVDGCYSCRMEYSDGFPYLTDGYNNTPSKPVIETEGYGFWEPNINIAAGYGGARAYPYLHYMMGGVGPASLDQDVWEFGTRWKEFLDMPERNWIGYMRTIMGSVAWHKLVPDNNLVVSDIGYRWTRIASAVSSDGRFAMVIVSGDSIGYVKLNLSRITSASSVKATWLNIDNGATADAGTYATSETPTLTLPGGWPGAVLRLVATSASTEHTVEMNMPNNSSIKIDGEVV